MFKGDTTVTTLLQEAFTKAAALPPAEQELLAARLLAKLAEEDEFDRASRLPRRNSRASLDRPSPITVPARRRYWIRTPYEFLHNEGFP